MSEGLVQQPSPWKRVPQKSENQARLSAAFRLRVSAPQILLHVRICLQMLNAAVGVEGLVEMQSLYKPNNNSIQGALDAVHRPYTKSLRRRLPRSASCSLQVTKQSCAFLPGPDPMMSLPASRRSSCRGRFDGLPCSWRSQAGGTRCSRTRGGSSREERAELAASSSRSCSKEPAKNGMIYHETVH